MNTNGPHPCVLFWTQGCGPFVFICVHHSGGTFHHNYTIAHLHTRGREYFCDVVIEMN